MKTAILLPNWVGDTCMATPTIRAIRQGMPEISELCVVGRYAPVGILGGLDWVDRSIVFKPKSKDAKIPSRRGLIASLKREGFDMIVLLPNSLSAGLIGYMSGIKRRVGYATDGRSWLLTDQIERPRADLDNRKLSTIEYYLGIASYLGCDARDRSMQLAVSDADRDLAVAMFDTLGLDWNRRTVVFNTYAATGTARQWSAGQAGRAANLLAKKYDVQVIIHCGPAERAMSNAIATDASHPLVKSMGQISNIPLGLSKAVLQHASVVLATDSGPRHIAAALNRPLVSLFGPTDPSSNATFNVPETNISVSMPCRPCSKHDCPLVHNNCMHALAYTRVVNAIVSRLRESDANSTTPFVPVSHGTVAA